MLVTKPLVSQSNEVINNEILAVINIKLYSHFVAFFMVLPKLLNSKLKVYGTALMVQWLRICFPESS